MVNRVVEDGFPEKVTSNPKYEGDERGSQVALGEERFGSRNRAAEEERGGEAQAGEGAGGQVVWGSTETVRTLTWGPGTHVLEFARPASSPPLLAEEHLV